jgi:hypothetical protein
LLRTGKCLSFHWSRLLSLCTSLSRCSQESFLCWQARSKAKSSSRPSFWSILQYKNLLNEDILSPNDAMGENTYQSGTTKVPTMSLISCLVADDWAHPARDDGAPRNNTRCFFLLSWIGPFWRNETRTTNHVKKWFNGYSRLSNVAAPFELNGIPPGYTTRPTCKCSASGGSDSFSSKKTRGRKCK